MNQQNPHNIILNIMTTAIKWQCTVKRNRMEAGLVRNTRRMGHSKERRSIRQLFISREERRTGLTIYCLC